VSFDEYGQQYLTEKELLKLMHINPLIDVGKVKLDAPEQFNNSTKALYAGFPKIQKYVKPVGSIEDFDKANQLTWAMPKEYKNKAIGSWLLSQCNTDEQKERVLEELELYKERDLLQLLKFLKYTIDTFRKKNIVWGVGRGSSVSSYVLFLIGVHKVDSIKYELDIKEFLR